ncbi:short-chain dehydrogenase/reductase [Arachidicoccus ginsenosidimutans]|uniref:oxidoreductase n=1 Tax=Arachidicoccus sp. BS20 TaxID=1850526 RepID=UPI0007F0756D|nr:oxidoreductase [Arachidicoccus sp. BS20]ANI90700.1 short-chain dehydrogenase/reductase [Arachidicoccus sp. BS20]
MSKVVLVTGASAGIGKATAKYLAENGYTVYGAARRVEKMNELLSLGIKVIPLDVTHDESMVNAVDEIIKAEGKIDILINNAGFGSYGAVEDVPMSDAKYQLEVNVFGAARLMQLVLPHMRKNGYGKIVNISSIGGKIAFPLGGWYHASKFALEGLSDSLRNEVKQFGIDVIVIEPGGIKSEWGNIAFDSMVKISGNTAYKNMVSKMQKATLKTLDKNPEPILIAKLIKKAIEVKNPKTRYADGYMAKPLLIARKIVSDKMLDKMVMSQMK